MSYIKHYQNLTQQIKTEYNDLLEMLKLKYLHDIDTLMFQQDLVEERLLRGVDNIDIDFVVITMRKTSGVLNKKLKEIETEYTKAIQIASEFYNCSINSVSFDERIYIRNQLF